MTQVQMAQALGIHWQTYQKFEYRSPLLAPPDPGIRSRPRLIA
jgi:DNA-binding XRE family transcriptional regulator